MTTTTYAPERWAPVLIRRSDVLDRPALRHLATLDSRRLPEGSFLVAEVDGELVAAAPIDSDEPALGDPFRHTVDIRRLLELQARLIRERGGAVALDRQAA
jgi:hypothetical protein